MVKILLSLAFCVLLVFGVWQCTAYRARSIDPESFYYAHKDELLQINEKIKQCPALKWIESAKWDSQYRPLTDEEKEIYHSLLEASERIGIRRIAITRNNDNNGNGDVRSIRYQISKLGFAYFDGTELTDIIYTPDQSVLIPREDKYYIKALDERDWYALIMLRDREQKVENGYELKRKYFKHVKR